LKRLKTKPIFYSTCLNPNNASISVDDLITTAFSPLKLPSQSEYYSKAWTALPHAPRHGAPGDGEAFLSFFCNGVKPKKGDIKIQSHDIELKGPQGRMYKNKTELGLADEQALQLLSQPDGIGKYIAAISGTQEYEQQIIDLINLNDSLAADNLTLTEQLGATQSESGLVITPKRFVEIFSEVGPALTSGAVPEGVNVPADLEFTEGFNYTAVGFDSNSDGTITVADLLSFLIVYGSDVVNTGSTPTVTIAVDEEGVGGSDQVQITSIS